VELRFSGALKPKHTKTHFVLLANFPLVIEQDFTNQISVIAGCFMKSDHQSLQLGSKGYAQLYKDS